jgi:hypothetical protein
MLRASCEAPPINRIEDQRAIVIADFHFLVSASAGKLPELLAQVEIPCYNRLR